MPKKRASVSDPKTAIVRAALALAASQGWGVTSLADIAREAGLTLAQLHAQVLDKADILFLIGRWIDGETLRAASAQDLSLPVRDVLFELLMERFDVLNHERAGIISILEHFKFDPKEALFSAPHLCRSMAWMLEAAGLSTTGVKGALRVAGLSALYLRVLRVWAGDETPDQSKTMAALDHDLARAADWAERWGF
jgi:AcrR family transcriptional regulator